MIVLCSVVHIRYDTSHHYLATYEIPMSLNSSRSKEVHVPIQPIPYTQLDVRMYNEQLSC